MAAKSSNTKALWNLGQTFVILMVSFFGPILYRVSLAEIFIQPILGWTLNHGASYQTGSCNESQTQL